MDNCRYEPEDYIAAHSDDERLMKYHSPIFSLSWGGPRRFVVKPKPYLNRPNDATLELLLRDGDLVIMGGSLQQTHKHEVPKWKKTMDMHVPTRRVNWTVRAYIPRG